MKKNKIYIVLLVMGCIMSCGKHEDDPIVPSQQEQTENKPEDDNGGVNPTYDPPHWNVATASQYECTMTMVLRLSESKNSQESQDDEMAVFCGTECRGVAERIAIGEDRYVWMALVYGQADGEQTLTIKYYSSTSKSLYQTSTTIPFARDTHYGTLDSPMTIEL